jgi:protein-tyrosine phosphatase
MSYVKLSDTLYYGIHPNVVKPLFHVDHYIDLTENHEIEIESIHDNIIKFPIKDRNVPLLKDLIKFINYLETLDGIMYIFCKGGHGRSGTISACLYGKINKLSGKEALNHINEQWKLQRDMTKIRPKIRKLGSPQTKKQKDIVITFLQ